MHDEDYRYDAFISYRHVEPDRGWAKWLHRALETYRGPRRLMANGRPASITRVFRDEEELPASADLSSEIESALQRSRFLVVVCSPRVVESRWCNAEVQAFHDLKRSDRILALLVEGEPSDAFVPALREVRRAVVDDNGNESVVVESVEPLAADVRSMAGESDKLRKHHAKLRLLASILGCDFDDLRQRHLERQQQRTRNVLKGLAALAVTLLALAGWALLERHAAVLARNFAHQQQTVAEVARDDARASEAKTRRTLARSLFVRASEELYDVNTPAALAYMSRAVMADPDYRSARIRLHSLLTTRRHAVPLVAFRANEPSPLAPPQFHDEKNHFWDGQHTWDLQSLELVSHAIDLTWARNRAIVRRAGQFLLLIPSYSPSGIDTTAVQLCNAAEPQSPLHLFRHEKNIVYFEFSHSGDRVVTAAEDGTARIWDVESGEAIGEPLRHVASLTMATFSPDDRRILTTSADNTARLWDSTTGEPLGEQFGHLADVLGGVFSDDGKRFVTWTARRAAYVWQPDWNATKPFATLAGFQGDILDARLSADQNLVGIALNDRTARVFDIRDNRRIRVHCEPVPHGSSVRWVAFDSSSEQFATAGFDAATKVWQLPRLAAGNHVDNREVLVTAAGRELEIRRSSQKDDRLVDVAKDRTIATFQQLGRRVTISPGGRYLLDTSNLKLSDTTTGDTTALNVASDLDFNVQEYGKPVNFSPDETRLLTLHNDDVARIWRLPQAEELLEIPMDVNLNLPGEVSRTINVGAQGARWSDDSSRVLLVGRRIVAYDATTGRRVHTFTPNRGKPGEPAADIPICACFDASGRFVAGGFPSSFQIWNVSTGKPVGFPVFHGDSVRAIAFGADAKRILAGSHGGKVRVYDVTTQRPLTDPMFVGGQVTDVGFSADGSLLLVATKQTVQVWDAVTSRPVTDAIPTQSRPLRIGLTADEREIRIESYGGSFERFGLDWSEDNSKKAVAFHADLANALAGWRLADDTNVMERLDPFELLRRLSKQAPDTPALAHVDSPAWKSWSLEDWVDSQPQPDTLQDAFQLSLRLPQVPFVQARLAEIYMNLNEDDQESIETARQLARNCAEWALVGQDVDPRVYYYLSRYHLSCGELENARVMIERAMRDESSDKRFRHQAEAVRQAIQDHGVGGVVRR